MRVFPIAEVDVVTLPQGKVFPNLKSGDAPPASEPSTMKLSAQSIPNIAVVGGAPPGPPAS